jgi:hypothetical protein
MEAMTTPSTSTTSNRQGKGARAGWTALALFLATFAIFESAKYGLPTATAALALFVLPDLTMLIGVRSAATLKRGQLASRAVPFYNAMHRAWIPGALLVIYSLGIVDFPPLFTAGLAWLTHIAVDRAAGYGLRDRDGFQRRG